MIQEENRVRDTEAVNREEMKKSERVAVKKEEERMKQDAVVARIAMEEAKFETGPSGKTYILDATITNLDTAAKTDGDTTTVLTSTSTTKEPSIVSPANIFQSDTHTNIETNRRPCTLRIFGR